MAIFLVHDDRFYGNYYTYFWDTSMEFLSEQEHLAVYLIIC